MAEENQSAFLITDPLAQADVVEVVPVGVAQVDLDNIPYRAEPMVHCAFCVQRQLHRDGYFAILSNGQRAPCGNCCAAAFDNVKKVTIDRKRNQLKKERDNRERARSLAVGLENLLPLIKAAEKAMTEMAEAQIILPHVFCSDALLDMEHQGIRGLSFLDGCHAHLTLAETTVKKILELDGVTEKELEVYRSKKKVALEQIQRAAKFILACDDFFDPVNLDRVSKWVESRGRSFRVAKFEVKGGMIRPKGPGMWKNFYTPRVNLEKDLRALAESQLTN